jgi:acylphosphatase
MKAVNIVLKGDPHKSGLRHCVISKAKESGINGYINYRRSGEELFLHAEGSKEAVNQYLSWLHSRSAELQITMEQMPASVLECQDFRICCDASLLLDVSPGEYQLSEIAEEIKLKTEILQLSPIHSSAQPRNNGKKREIQKKNVQVPGWVPSSINNGVRFIMGRLKLTGLF